MSDVYRIFGAEVSPYSVKVRSYFRYKGIAHEWIVRSGENQAESQKYAKLPLIPIVATPEDTGMQDSTPIIETLEAKFPEPSIHPGDPVAKFVSALIEEFGDEWGNKWMFHYRWAREVDQDSAAERIAATMAPGADEKAIQGIAAGIKERMVNRVWFVGSSPQTAPQIEDSFEEGVGQLEAHLANRPFLFGGRPAFGDFGLWGQVYNAWTDPTCKEILESRAPKVVAWIERMLEPKAEGDFEAWSQLAATLEPFVETQIGGLFLPWSQANAQALEQGQEEFSVELRGRAFNQKPQKYHARSLAALREKYAASAGNAELDALLERTGCKAYLA